MAGNVPQLLDVQDVARALRVSPYTVRRWASGPDAKLHVIRLGRRVLFHPDDVAAMVECARKTVAASKSES